MPRGVYDRSKSKKRRNGAQSKNTDAGVTKLLDLMKVEKTKREDVVVALGTAIDALEALEQ